MFDWILYFLSNTHNSIYPQVSTGCIFTKSHLIHCGTYAHIYDIICDIIRSWSRVGDYTSTLVLSFRINNPVLFMGDIFLRGLSERVIRWTWSDESDNDFLSPVPSPSLSPPSQALLFSASQCTLWSMCCKAVGVGLNLNVLITSTA